MAASPRAKVNLSLVRALRSAHRIVADHGLRPGSDPSDARAPASASARNLIRVAMLAPDLQAAILAGRQPPALTLTQMMAEDLPCAWPEQRRALGFA